MSGAARQFVHAPETCQRLAQGLDHSGEGAPEPPHFIIGERLDALAEIAVADHSFARFSEPLERASQAPREKECKTDCDGEPQKSAGDGSAEELARASLHLGHGQAGDVDPFGIFQRLSDSELLNAVEEEVRRGCSGHFSERA